MEPIELAILLDLWVPCNNQSQLSRWQKGDVVQTAEIATAAGPSLAKAASKPAPTSAKGLNEVATRPEVEKRSSAQARRDLRRGDRLDGATGRRRRAGR
jgi:hypothetical protein